MFTNKHVIIAFIVAPILAILAWFAVGNLMGEKAAPAQEGQSYPLVEKSNCRYDSGVCHLENEDFRLALSYQDTPAGRELVLRSSHPLDGVALAVAVPGSEVPPGMMRAVDGQGMEWRLPVDSRPGLDQRIMLVASSGGSSYFADAATAFLQPREGMELTR